MEKGVQRISRSAVSAMPATAPYFWIASYEYIEQVGVKPQRVPNTGDSVRLYSSKRARHMRFNI